MDIKLTVDDDISGNIYHKGLQMPKDNAKSTEQKSYESRQSATPPPASFCLAAKQQQQLQPETNCNQCNGKVDANSLQNDDTKSTKARFLKAFILLAASVGTAYVCLLSSQRYLNSWIQTVIESTDVHVATIPFPAVTICPVKGLDLLLVENEAKDFLMMSTKQESHNGTNAYNSAVPPVDNQTLNEFHLLLSTINEIMWPRRTTLDNQKYLQHIKRIENILEIWSKLRKNSSHTNMSMMSDIPLRDLSTFFSFKCEDIFAECTWKRKSMPCCDLFHKLYTYKGICFAFNSILVENPKPSWPWYVSESGLLSALRVTMKRSSLGGYYESMATMIHDPKEIGSTDFTYLDSEKVLITISPLRFTADHEIRCVEPEVRHCYFTNEKKLLGKGRGDCMRNCRLKYIERRCNCTYFLPMAAMGKIQSSLNSLPVCDKPHLKCIYEHRHTLFTTGNVLEEYISESESKSLDCQCYPDCNYVQYQTTVNIDNTGQYKKRDIIELQVQYQHNTMFSYRSSLRFTLLDLVVSYGGIAGLFLGFSLVGIIEALYNFIICRKKKKQRQSSFEKDQQLTKSKNDDKQHNVQ